MINPYDEGIAAARAGKGRHENPYPPQKNERACFAWDDGWWSVADFSDDGVDLRRAL